MQIRAETASDITRIEAVTLAAFATAAYSEHREHLIIEALRRCDRLTVSLVADLEGVIVGHAAASPVAISDGTAGWYGLGPVSVLPGYQGRGFGAALVREVLHALMQEQAAGCVVLGEPDYYRRFGFGTRADLRLPGVPAEYFQAAAFGPGWPRGDVTYDAAFMI
jgi:predicted N-acetyltransferase YhbS